MKKLLITILLILIVPVIAHSNELYHWSTEDTSIETTFAIFTIIDWWRTKTFTRNPDEYMDERYISSIIGHAAVSYYLPRPYRELWQTVWIRVDNKRYEIRLRIPF